MNELKELVTEIVNRLPEDYQLVIHDFGSKFNKSRIEKRVETWLYPGAYTEEGTYTVSVIVDIYKNGENIAYVGMHQCQDRPLENILNGRLLSQDDTNSLQELLVDIMERIKDKKIQLKKRINTDEHISEINNYGLSRIADY